MKKDSSLVFKNQEDWRSWLLDNHDTYSEVWLLHYKKSSKNKNLHHSAAVEEALCFGWIDSTLKKIDDDSFILRYTPRKEKSVWSKINRDKAEQLIAQGKMTPAGLKKIKEAQMNGLWDAAYTNKIKDIIPDDLKQALLTNKKAWEHFNMFANSYQNQYIGWVNTAKTITTRMRRISEVVKRSASNKKPGM